MEGPITIPSDGNVRNAVQSSIKQKLSEITESQVDDVLPEYVMVMVVNQKTKAQVATDLVAFLGADQAQTFTNWLWDNLNAMLTNQPASSKRQPKSDDEGDHLKTHAGRERDRESKRSNDKERDTSKSVFASVITVPQTAERQRTTLENPAPSRLILSAVQDAVRSTSVPAPTRGIELAREQRERRDHSRENKDRESREKPRDSIFERLGARDADMDDGRRAREERRPPLRSNNEPSASRSNNNYNSPTISSTSTTTTTDNNNNNNNDNVLYLPDTTTHKRKVEGAEEAPVTFTVTLSGVKDDPVSKPLRNKRRSYEPTEENTEMEAGEGTGKKAKKERCQFWPACKKGDECPFIHPTQKCNAFPNCTYGDKCLFIHPSVPCKFGSKCTRPDCAFTHPAPSVAGGKPSFPAAAGANAKPCKHGYACPREGCTYFHPPDACLYGDACARPDCAFAHGKPCRFGVSCATPGCTFTHAHAVKTPCKFGAGCLNVSCRFLHDTPKPAALDTSMADVDTTAISATLPPTPPTVPAV